MNKTNSIIEVNGNRYDAVTGKQISAGKKLKSASQSSPKKMIDGFVLGAHHSKTQIKKTSSLVISKARAKTEAQGLHRQPQKPKTLIRKGLKKPGGPEIPKASSPVSARHNVVDPLKQLRAKTVTRHSQVNRFGHFTRAQQQTSEVINQKSSPAARKAGVEVKLPAPPPSLITSVSHRKLEKLLDEGLMRAEAHRHMLNHKPHNKFLGPLGSIPRWLSFSLVGFLIAAFAIFMIWQNLPAVAVHVAAAKAHVNATMPAYTPTGFIYQGPLQYEPGAITMKFKDKTDSSQKFLLTQKASNWSSASLEANALPDKTNVQTSEVNGTTVYIYGQNNDATWVNHNVLYDLKNQAQLSSDQVLRIVQGL